MARKSNLIDKARMEKVRAAVTDEHTRFNYAASHGHRAMLKTFSGIYEVTFVSPEWWYSTKNQQSWCGCNDGTWADLMAQVGEKRNPLFE